MYSVHDTCLRCIVYTVHRTLYTVHRTLNSVNRTVCSAYCTLYSVHRTLCSVHCTTYIVRVCTIQYTPYTMYTTAYTIHRTSMHYTVQAKHTFWNCIHRLELGIGQYCVIPMVFTLLVLTFHLRHVDPIEVIRSEVITCSLLGLPARN